MTIKTIYWVTPILFLILINSSTASTECFAYVTIIYKFNSLNEINPLEFSEYQYPEFKEGDILILDSIEIINEGTCEYPESIFNISINPKVETLNRPFQYKFELPALDSKDTFSLYLSDISYDYSEVSKFLYQEYTDNFGNKFTSGGMKLFPPGIWEVNPSLTLKNSSQNVSSGARYGIVNLGNSFEIPTFNVIPKSEIENQETARKSLNFNKIGSALTFIGIMVAVIGILISVVLFNKEIKNKKKLDDGIQKNLLESIETQLRCVDRDIQGHQEEFNKNPPTIPSYDISTLDPNMYITNLRSRLNNKETGILKERLILIRNKVSNINRLLHLAQEYDSKISSDTTKNPHIIELKDEEYKYHKHLKKLIEATRENLKQFTDSKLE